MTINPLTPNLIHLLSSKKSSGTSGRTSDSLSNDFGSILTKTFRDASDLDAIDKVNTLQLLTGEADDFSGLLIDVHKAELSLNLALQIRNKIVDAYNEVMRMQV